MEITEINISLVGVVDFKKYLAGVVTWILKKYHGGVLTWILRKHYAGGVTCIFLNMFEDELRN